MSTVFSDPTRCTTDRDRNEPEELRRRFTDRTPYTTRFREKLVQEPPVPVLMFYGVGGVGKTYLLRYLQGEHCPGRNPAHPAHVCAFLSFRDGHTSISTAEGLWQARELLHHAEGKLVFPRFDLLWAKFWERSYHVPVALNRDLLPPEVGALNDLLQILHEFPVVDDVVKAAVAVPQVASAARQIIAANTVRDWFRQGIEMPKRQGWRAALQTMALGELSALLPLAFAADLAQGAARLAEENRRVVIFVDNYETAQEQLGDSAGKEPDSFVTLLAEELIRLDANVQIVIAGRNRLHWAEVRPRDGAWVEDPASIWARGLTRYDSEGFTSQYLEQLLVGDLSEDDALHYLQTRRHLADAGLARRICDFTGGYPLALGVAADLVQDADLPDLKKFEALRSRATRYLPLSAEWRLEVNHWLLQGIIEQLERASDTMLISMIRAASIPRWFTRELLCSLVRQDDIAAPMQRLERYSFVEPYGVQGSQAYRLHPLIRKLLRQGLAADEPELCAKWDNTAAGWFAAQAQRDGDAQWRYRAEMLYHTWYLDPQDAMQMYQDWRRALGSGQVDICWGLLNTASEVENTLPLSLRIQLKLDASRLHSISYSAASRPDEHRLASLHLAEEALALSDGLDEAQKGEVYHVLGHALHHMAMGGLGDAAACSARAMEMFRRQSQVAEILGDWRRLGNSYMLRARIKSAQNPEFGDLGLIDKAIRLYEDAGTEGRPGLADTFREKAVLAIHSRNWPVAEEALQSASQIHESLAKEDIPWDAACQQLWGELYAHSSRWREAIGHFERARELNGVLRSIWGICAATGWQGICQCHLGEVEQGLALVREALQTERDILGSQEGVGKWLRLLGEYYASRDEYPPALEALWLAERVFESVAHAELAQTTLVVGRVRSQLGDAEYARLRSAFRVRRSSLGEYVAHWGFETLVKSPENPILAPRGDSWESRSLFNPAAWADENRVWMLYRAEGPAVYRGRELTSRIGLAVSDDGLHFRDQTPVLEPMEAYEIPGGCEDPRLVSIDGVFYLTYTAFDGRIARLAMATSGDLRQWEKWGPIFPDSDWERFFPIESHRRLFPRGWCKSGAILAQPVNDFHWMYFGDTHIWAAYSRDLRHWDVVAEPVLSPRPGRFDARLVEPGPPPLMTSEGIWLGYNGADDGLRYCFGQALFAGDNPTRVIGRSTRPLLEPETPDELMGSVPQVVFGEGLVRFNGRWLLYYGMADSRIGVATCESDALELR
jgi:predicted GH43/DUF377 family glycosyl hydrolase